MAFLGSCTVHETAKITVKTIVSGAGRWYQIMVDDVCLASVFHANGLEGELPEIIVEPPLDQEVAA